MAFADTRIRSLEIARQCALLGARQRTIAWVTGLSTKFILRNVFDASQRAPRGRPPYTEDFLFRSSLKVQAELSCFATRYDELKRAGFTPAVSLIAAYRHYRSFATAASFSFDEAFFLVSNLDGVWACRSPTLQLEPCPNCRGTRLVACGAGRTRGCALCKAQHPRRSARRREPARSKRIEPGGASAALSARIETMKLRRNLESLGAHYRVIAALLPISRGHSGRPPAGPLAIGEPLPLERWTDAVPALKRAQYSVLAATFTRLTDLGFARRPAVIAAFRHVGSTFHSITSPSFDRCFEVISLLPPRPGAARPCLQLARCDRCGCDHLVSTSECAASSCPFCELLRDPCERRSGTAPIRR